jgi:hypothetical protein
MQSGEYDNQPGAAEQLLIDSILVCDSMILSFDEEGF